MKKIINFILTAAIAASLAACSADKEAENNVIKVGASPSPHREILRRAEEDLRRRGYRLEIVEFTDYVQPNIALDNGELDANFFQHQPYLDSFNADNGTKVVSVAQIHFEPLGLYPGKTSDIADIKDGAVIAVPNDESNEARALLLLQQLGLIKIKEDAGLKATPVDIIENPYNIEIYEIEAAQLPNILPDVDFAVINGNYAVGAGILDKILASEDSRGEAAQTYANILAVKEGDENSEKTQALIKALTGEKIKDFIEEKYQGVFVPVF